MSPSFDAIKTLAAWFAFTVVAILFDVAGEPVAHVAVDVITTVTASLFTNPEVVYVALFVPTLLPFNFH